jgi:hypothetical protein
VLISNISDTVSVSVLPDYRKHENCHSENWVSKLKIKPDPISYDVRVLVHGQKLRCMKDETTDRHCGQT